MTSVPKVDFSRATVMTLLAIFASLYVIDLTSLPLSIDDELGAFRTAASASVWISQGRWTTYFFDLLIMPYPVLPFLPIAVFGVALVAAYLFLFKAIRQSPNSAAALLAFPLFAAFPSWSFLTEFQSNTPAAGFGVLACCVAVERLVHLSGRQADAAAGWRGRAATTALIAGLIALAIGTYQSMFMLYVVLGFSVTLVNSVNHQHITIRMLFGLIFSLILTSSLGLLFYLIIFVFFKVIFVADTTYIQSFIQIKEIIYNPIKVLIQSLKSFLSVYAGRSEVYMIDAWAFPLVAVSGIVALASTPKLSNRVGLRVALVVLYVLTMAVPFAMNPVSGGQMPYRSYVSVAAVFWLAAILALTTPIMWFRRLFFVMVTLGVFQTYYSNYVLQTGGILVREHDAATAAAVYQKIAEAQPTYDRGTPYPVIFFGPWYFNSRYAALWSSTAGASFFEWDDGNTYRAVTYMKLLGYSNLEPASADDRERLKAVAQTMPVWPGNGSVQVVDGITLVKMGAFQ